MALNERLEAVRACAFTTEVGDAFEVMVRLARAGSDYDLVIVDPPSFAQRQVNVDGALRAYTRLTHLAVRLVRPGGTLLQASCSSRVAPAQFFTAVVEAAQAAGRPLIELARSGHDVDHPVTFREGGYLKAGFWTVGAGR
jgi:23S rRNA (cytosine1962-C5)-methyltransferase